jgi:hypothetical protein
MPRTKQQYLPLTEGQLAYLRDGEDPKSVDSMHYDIRNRLFHTLRNGDVLTRLPQNQREQIFDMREKKTTNPGELERDDATTPGDVDPLAQRGLWELNEGYQEFQRGLIHWLAFLYTGIEGAANVADVTQPVGHDYDLSHDEMSPEERTTRNPEIVAFDFRQMLEKAIETAARQKGEQVTEFELRIETEPIQSVEPPSSDTESLRSRFESGDPELTGLEIAHLQSEVDDIGQREIEAYYEEIYETPTDRGEGIPAPDKNVLEEPDTNDR